MTTIEASTEIDLLAEVKEKPAGRPKAEAPGRLDALVLTADGDNAPRWSPRERLHHLFEQRCDLFEQRGETAHLAIDSEEASLTYGELDRRANRLARYLIRQGFGAGDTIGLLFDRSVHSYVSLLAVQKINAAYVPLDVGFPADRIGYIAADASICAILTLSTHGDGFKTLTTPLICLDRVESEVAAENDARLGIEETGYPLSELAYIIYTSGTTGRPKGVPIQQASICNFVRVAAEVYGYRSDDRVYQGLTIAFDFSVEEIWVPLIAGATLVPNQTGRSLVGSDLQAFLAENRVTALCCVPTLLATIEEDLPALRLLITSGEACPHDLVKRWHREDRSILNAYGPTEATVTATVTEMHPDRPVTIGGPLPTYSIVILAPEENRALPRGEVGEIAIAGVCLATGYLGREDLTKKAFIDDFLSIPNNPSKRIYRTGDLGRVNPAGQIEYLGRIDTQVKIRGYRIELTEIESVIMQLSGIAQAVVDTYEPEAGVKELVAYYTTGAGSAPLAADAIAEELQSLLPKYMVPAFYEPLDIIPMTPSDKADRKALPPPSGPRLHRSNGAYVAPEGPLESEIASILAELMKLEKVSAKDHFFDDLGANSLLMARLSTRIRQQLEITDFSMREMYLHPTVSQLAGYLQSLAQGRRALRRNRSCHIPSNFSYYGCAMAQLLLVFGFLCLVSTVLLEGFAWVFDAASWEDAYWRAVGYAAGVFGLSVALPVAAKWLLIGRWREEEFPVWSLRYLRFWLVKNLVRLNPVIVFSGTPIYVAYLRLLGAKVSWEAVIFPTILPVATDLIAIGSGSLIRRDCLLSGYRAEGNRIRTGRVTIGRNCFVGDGTVLDVNTVMEDGSQLGHSSALHAGQHLAAGQSYHGSPAEKTITCYDRLGRGRLGLLRKLGYPLGLLATQIFLWVPLFLLLLRYVFGLPREDLFGGVAAIFTPGAATWQVAPEILFWTACVFFGALLLALTAKMILPRLLYLFIKPDRTYPLFGVRFGIYRGILAVSNSEYFNRLFGDSSFIVHYLQAIGYRCSAKIQTGSNFGLEQWHGVPFLCSIGDGTLVSDGLHMLNDEISNSAFRLSEGKIGARCFVGTDVYYPAGARVGDDCLVATKAMVPIDGPMQENTGLLGSPCFAIPRTTRRDQRSAALMDPDAIKQRLRRKNASNLRTMILVLASNWFLFCAGVMILHYVLVDLNWFNPLALAFALLAIWVAALAYSVVVDRAILGFKPLQPKLCSIYDKYYWRHERYWKLGMKDLMHTLNGTPFKNLIWRALGVRIGKKVFDDGAFIVERSLVTIGDYCTLNLGSLVQCHSLEDGTFKSDHSVIGEGCTLGANSLVHYGVTMGPNSVLEPDSFMMKGERSAAHSCWSGNPAKEVQVIELESDQRGDTACMRAVKRRDEMERTGDAEG